MPPTKTPPPVLAPALRYLHRLTSERADLEVLKNLLTESQLTADDVRELVHQREPEPVDAVISKRQRDHG